LYNLIPPLILNFKLNYFMLHFDISRDHSVTPEQKSGTNDQRTILYLYIGKLKHFNLELIDILMKYA